MTSWEPDDYFNVSARLYQQRAVAHVQNLRSDIAETRRIIDESRKLLDRLAAKSGAIVP
ncbi:hypothetical protein NKI12_28635 [Mesorhizobium australicum]|uniref:Uncharacterized protein n=1 Tax=Mesorhizobium australicum TaxID=536018 RepID=A0ACC6T7C7_9HYPH